MDNNLEAPWVSDTPEDGEEFRCPVCGEHCEEFYTQDGAIIGCENCINICDAWEWEQDYGTY